MLINNFQSKINSKLAKIGLIHKQLWKSLIQKSKLCNYCHCLHITHKVLLDSELYLQNVKPINQYHSVMPAAHWSVYDWRLPGVRARAEESSMTIVICYSSASMANAGCRSAPQMSAGSFLNLRALILPVARLLSEGQRRKYHTHTHISGHFYASAPV